MKQLLFLLLLATTPSLLKAQYISPAQKRAIRWDNKSEYKKMSEKDGDYLFFNIGVRKHEYEANTNLDNQNLSGLFGLNYGVNRSSLSYEIGVNFIYHTYEKVVFDPNFESKFSTIGRVNSLVVPVSIRYSIPLNASQRLRFGANFTANWIAKDINDSLGEGKGYSFLNSSDSEKFYYEWNEEMKSPFFFKAGIHVKMKFLNSSYLIFQASQAFTFGPTRRFNFDWRSSNDQGQFHVDTRFNGFMVEMGYIIPINVIGAKFTQKSEK